MSRQHNPQAESLFIPVAATDSLHVRRFSVAYSGPPGLLLYGSIKNARIFMANSRKGIVPYLTRMTISLFLNMNKTAFTSFLVLLLAAVALSSCEQCGNVTIAQPTVADSEWLVYKENDTLVFEAETGAEVRYVRTGIYAQSIPGEGFSAEDACIDQVDILARTVLEDLGDIQPPLGTRILSRPNDLVVSLSVGEKAGETTEDTGIWEIDETSPTHDSLAVNGQMYYEVFELNLSNAGTNRVKQLLYNKAFGFLRVEFFNGPKLDRVADE
ncbi:hypothetical protein MKJ04_17695 [Pontibacter sp. E15-1]|uniref:hypothetical protein n=1 Tax=Pontibacter sp. E15-1 TaxID=2919918 RepID=UPI001F503979|nr:hypothetical protein [Pontibacter sp. E15-1]MCJ8166684.1 hypothetical protein [Pontibacter sp. E15-1]